MAKNKTHWRDCRSKIRFKDEYEAAEHIRKYPKPMRIYYCVYCDGFHTTSRVEEYRR